MRHFLFRLVVTFFLPLSSQADNTIKIPPLHHVVDVAVPERMVIPDEFSLSARRTLQCNTCHGIENMETTAFEEVNRDADEFFRGGPYRKLSNLCYRCHSRSAYARANIHIQLDDENKLIEKNCLFCHQQLPDRKKGYRDGEIKLRLTAQKLCIGCHLRTPHLNAIEHHVEVTDDMLLQIEATEKKEQLVLPLDGRRVQCITCHSPHQQGVLDAQRAAARQVQDRDLQQGVGYIEHPWNEVYQQDKKQRLEVLAKNDPSLPELKYQRLRYEVLLRLPALNGRLCSACHTFEH